MFAIIDCGTTNTRVYILDNNYNIASKGFKKVGVRDTAISGSNQILKDGIVEAFNMALESGSFSLNQIEYAIAFGMITSEIGLIEIPHLTAPVSIEDLAGNVKVVRDINIFPNNIPVVFIRGIKNKFTDFGLRGIRKIDFMRGEETQVTGVLKQIMPKLPINIIVLSSHTKLINVDERSEIKGCITTISGQIFEAIKKETSIGVCMKSTKENECVEDFFSEEILNIAYESVINSGFIRTLLMPRLMNTLLKTEWYERKFFVDAAIAAEDMKIFNEAKETMGFEIDTDIILIGHKERCMIYEYLIKKQKGFSNNVVSIWDKEDIDMLAIKGATEIVQRVKDFKSI
jgi:2-dehydro-3-deoxygalactonokinase